MEISDLKSKAMAAIYQAKHGDLRPLVELLRSGEPLDQRLRDYIAHEIEKEAGKRFRRGTGRKDLEQRKRDDQILSGVYLAKFHLSAKRLGLTDEHSDEEFSDAVDPASVTDADALEFLFDEWGMNVSTTQLNNARRRNPNNFIDRWGRRKRP